MGGWLTIVGEWMSTARWIGHALLISVLVPAEASAENCPVKTGVHEGADGEHDPVEPKLGSEPGVYVYYGDPTRADPTAQHQTFVAICLS